ncbi:aminopeptidase N-like [Eupeodes corollae]|uniref:aminopeptidase N-like n=1 Tax=Eupeodes corollae TaxID=290404 RepID=UPI00248F6BF4|nr:aminopeptidase N-like [Eupeodes corollae]
MLALIAFLKIALFLPPFFVKVQSVSFSSADVFDHDSNITSKSHIRLPSALIPTKYYVHINTRIHENIRPFNGNVTIELRVIEPTDEIVLHAKYLYDFEVSLRNLKTGEELEGLRFVHEHKLNFLRIFGVRKELNLKPGELYRLEILFGGTHQDANYGFYMDSYLDDKGQEIPLAITQFEPTNARMTFPCFDEPHLKSRFIITVTHGSNYTALSNMPVDGVPIQNADTKMTTTTFLKTPKMSTYLVAFAVTNYHHISEIVNNREHRVFFPPNSKDNGSHALKNGISSLSALENYFGIEYPLPKLDHIRVEKTYGIAMENWGLLTYNNKNFVTNIRNNSLEEVHKIISQNHEIAHQWFGNLVSPKWWTYVWLKEGFAVYFSYVATQLIFPEKNMDKYLLSREMREAFKHSYHHPMTSYVEEEFDIRKAYNMVSYRFGGCFVRMFHHAIGHKTFIKGVALYLTRFQYSVADENDLFKALQEAVDEDGVELFQNNRTATIMRSWTHNIGIPIVMVTRNFDNGTITIRQKSKKDSSKDKWWIPLSFATASRPDFEKTTADYILPPEEEVTISLLEDLSLNVTNSDWLIVDKQQTGLYHVVYDDQSMRLIAESLNKDHKQIHLFNRAKFLRDLVDLEDRNAFSVDTLLDVIQYLKYEEDLLAWEYAADLILLFYHQLHGSRSHEMFKSFIRDLVGDVFKKIYSRSKDDLSLSVSLKDKILKIACEVDLTDCLHYTQKLTSDYFLNELNDEHLKSDFTLCQGLKTAAFEEFKKLVTKITTPDGSIVKFYEFLFSLKCVRSLENIRYFLDIMSMDIPTDTSQRRSKYARTQALSMLYLLNHEARPMIFEFLVQKDKQTAMAIRDGATNMEGKNENEMSARKIFQRKYEENIIKWLEKYNAKRELARTSDSSTYKSIA